MTNPTESPATSPATSPSGPLRYVCLRAAIAPKLDGRGDDAAWGAAAWTADFVDIEGDAKPQPRHRTRAKMMWDDNYFYVLAEMAEPHVWGSLVKRNSLIYHDNDFEIFIDPDGDRKNYYEFEINALGTTMELTLPRPYVDGGNYTFVELEGIRSAVHVRGTVNDASDVDEGWSVEVAIPFAGLEKLTAGGGRKPNAGETWRVNFSRVQWMHEVAGGVGGKYVKVPKETQNEDNWVWSPQGVVDMHRPEKWGVVEFGG